MPALQLAEHRQMEDRLRSVLRKRAAKPLRSLGVDWADLLREAIAERAPEASDQADDRYAVALREQAEALERITTRKLSVLVGRAGTGKTTVLSALLKAKTLVDDGVLFLAPDGQGERADLVEGERRRGADGSRVPVPAGPVRRPAPTSAPHRQLDLRGSPHRRRRRVLDAHDGPALGVARARSIRRTSSA